MIKLRYYKFKVEPFEFELRVYFCPKAFEQDTGYETGDALGLFAHSGRTLAIYIDAASPDKLTDTVYHEALHATTFVWDVVGADLDLYRNDEVLAYTQTYVARLVMQAYDMYEDAIAEGKIQWHND